MQETQYEDRKEVRIGPLAELLRTTKKDLLDPDVKSVTITPLNPDAIGDRLVAMIRGMNEPKD